MTNYTGWFYHIPSQISKPVPPGHWIKVIDNEGDVIEGWSEEFNWDWNIDPYGNIIQYCIRISVGFDMIKSIVDSIPEKGRRDILI